MKGLWLIRHGALPPQPERRIIGARDLTMSAAGRAQIQELAHAFMPGLIPELRAVICSDLGRCVQSAEILLKDAPTRIPLYLEPGLREICLGDWEGLNFQEISSIWPGVWAARGLDMAAFVPPGGESFRMVQRRALEALCRWRKRYPEGILLMVSHAGVMRALLARFQGLALGQAMRIPLDYADKRFIPGW